jgi:hypothetical protein
MGRRPSHLVQGTKAGSQSSIEPLMILDALHKIEHPKQMHLCRLVLGRNHVTQSPWLDYNLFAQITRLVMGNPGKLRRDTLPFCKYIDNAL